MPRGRCWSLFCSGSLLCSLHRYGTGSLNDRIKVAIIRVEIQNCLYNIKGCQDVLSTHYFYCNQENRTDCHLQVKAFYSKFECFLIIVNISHFSLLWEISLTSLAHVTPVKCAFLSKIHCQQLRNVCFSWLLKTWHVGDSKLRHILTWLDCRSTTYSQVTLEISHLRLVHLPWNQCWTTF